MMGDGLLMLEDIRRFIVKVYGINYPNEEKFGLQSQIRRAVISISLNLVEGNSRATAKDYLHFCYIAKGSLSETIECIKISCRLNYISELEQQPLLSEAESILKQINSLIKYLKSKIQHLESNQR